MTKKRLVRITLATFVASLVCGLFLGLFMFRYEVGISARFSWFSFEFGAAINFIVALPVNLYAGREQK